MMSEINLLQAQFGGRMSAINLHDANSERQSGVLAKGKNVYTKRLVFNVLGRKVEVTAGEFLACVSVFGDFDILRFTVNAKDRSGFGSESIGFVRIDSSPLEVFTEDGKLTISQNAVLRSDEFAELIRRHQFKKGDALHFYRNCVVLYVHRADVSCELISRMIALSNILPAINDTVENVELPPEFSTLVDIARKWAVSDDLQRSDKIENASEHELNNMLAVVKPQLEAIHVYLGRVREDTVNADVADLARIVETVMEVNIELARRRKDGWRPSSMFE